MCAHAHGYMITHNRTRGYKKGEGKRVPPMVHSHRDEGWHLPVFHMSQIDVLPTQSSPTFPITTAHAAHAAHDTTHDTRHTHVNDHSGAIRPSAGWLVVRTSTTR